MTAPKDQADLFATPDETDDGRPSGMRQQKPKKSKQDDAIATMATSQSKMWRIGVCEGAAMFRKRLLHLLQKWDGPTVPVSYLLADIGEIDDAFRKQFGDEYQRQVEMRTHG